MTEEPSGQVTVTKTTALPSFLLVTSWFFRNGNMAIKTGREQLKTDYKENYSTETFLILKDIILI